MRCVSCDKESNNLRVCPYCMTPYPASATGKGNARGSTSGRAAAEPGGNAVAQFFAPLKTTFLKQTPVVRWSLTGIAAVLVIWSVTGGEPASPPLAPGSTPSNIIATPMQREEALALIKRTRETALVELQADEVFVSYPAATFPLLPEGQFALAQQFARADEIVEGRKRRIFFHNPAGKLFAQSDGVTGVTVAK